MKATFPVGLVLVCLLSVFGVERAMAISTPEKTPVHTSNKSEKPLKPVQKTKPVKKPTPVVKHRPIAAKSKSASEIVRTTKLPSAKVDLSLPPEMVKQLQPIGSVPLVKRVPLLPPFFGEKPKEDSNFQLNGRLISNEMQLQLRNEERREVDGAALEFEFKQ